jgi:S-phase kinase-associated protein 1
MLCEFADDDDEEVPLMDVKTATLRKIVEYMEHYKDAKAPEIEKPLRSSDMTQVVPEWDASFVDVSQELLFELILGANYMDVKPLLDLACAKVASVSLATALARSSAACMGWVRQPLLLERTMRPSLVF